MKKKLFIAAIAVCAFAISASAQTNFQTFYDLGRKHFTTTLEGFHQDNWGNTFFFIDYDYNYREGNTVVSPNNTYFEIARCLNFWGDSALAPLSLQVEYNGGFGTASDMLFAFPVNSGSCSAWITSSTRETSTTPLISRPCSRSSSICLQMFPCSSPQFGAARTSLEFLSSASAVSQISGGSLTAPYSCQSLSSGLESATTSTLVARLSSATTLQV